MRGAEFFSQRFGELKSDVRPFPLRMAQDGRLDLLQIGAVSDQEAPQTTQLIDGLVPVEIRDVLAGMLESQP